MTQTTKLEQTPVNMAGTFPAADAELTRAGSRPVRYMLIDKDGAGWGIYPDATEAVIAATRLWPDQPQDTSGDHEEPNGWYVEALVAK